MRTIDLTKEVEIFDNGTCKWYVHKHFQDYIESKQASNLPLLKGFACFIAKNSEIEDIVLVDHNQNVIDARPNSNEGWEQIEAKINILKISKHFDDEF